MRLYIGAFKRARAWFTGFGEAFHLFLWALDLSLSVFDLFGRVLDVFGGVFTVF